MQKLRKVDPETLILNFSHLSKNDVPEKEAESNKSSNSVQNNSDIQVEEVSDDVSFATGGIQKDAKKQVFVFAAYIPPGKHLAIVRDVGTDLNKIPSPQIS